MPCNVAGMPEIKRDAQPSKRRKSGKGKWEYVISDTEKKLLRKIGLKISKDLYNAGKSSEWLAFRVGIARSTVQEVIAGRSNVRILTLNQIVEGLNYNGISDFMKSL